MKFLFTYAAIFGTAFAVPTPQGFGSTANDISSSVCKEVTFIFARGSTEGGNMGMAVGPPFANALKQSFGKDNVAVQGVDYPADIAGAITGTMNPTNAPGATKMTSLVQQALQKCPSTKVVLSGYSQGASQVHGALQNLKTDANKVAVSPANHKYLPFDSVTCLIIETRLSSPSGTPLTGWPLPTSTSLRPRSTAPPAMACAT